MGKASRVLALDIGAAGIKLAEFAYGTGNVVTLLAFDYREYGEELSEETREFVIGSLLAEMIQQGGYDSTKALVSISGQYALTRFVPLPPVAEEESRVRQIVEFEARQNVPFPMEEVIWDYQLISNPGAEELEVMFVVIKNEIVEEITSAVQHAGLEPVLVDVAPAACYNAARANLIGDDECAMILNLGGRSTNLLFADKQQFFARTIPIAGHSITQQIAKEFGMDPEKAEDLKRRHGFVALGGAYAEPESEVAASVSKIVRNVMTRLHGEINRSIGVYRAQQKGSKPQKLYLTGGSSIMGFTDRFFQDKLGLPVEYFNPFQCVQMGPDVDLDRLENMAHIFSEVVGLGLRYRGQCAVEVSLMPESIVRQMAMHRRKPYFIASAAALLLMLLLAWLAYAQKDRVYRDLVLRNSNLKTKLEETRRSIERRISSTENKLAEYRFFETFVASREDLPRVFNVMESLKPPDVWFSRVEPLASVATSAMADMMPEGPSPDAVFELGGVERPGEVGMPKAVTIEVERIQIAGFILEGHSIELTDEDREALAPPKRVSENTAPVREPGIDNPGPPAEMEGRTAPEGPFAVAANDGAQPDEGQGAGTSDLTAGLLPAELLEKRLKEHPLFKSEGTRFVTYTTVPSVQNLKKFTMRVVLEEPIEMQFE